MSLAWRPVPLTSPVACVLRHGLARRWEEPVRFSAVKAKALGSFSSHPIDRLRVTLDDGRELAVIFKRLIPEPGRMVGREVLIYAESAAIGLAAWDVAKLLEGWGSHRTHLLDGYVSAFKALAQLDHRAFHLDLAYGRVMRGLRLIYWWKEPCQSDPSARSVLDGIEEAWAARAEAGHGG